MKKILICLVMALPFVVTAQEKSDWKEMSNFHTLMSTSFHPSEEGNLKPVKTKSDSLVIAAKLWKASKVPAGYKPKETSETLTKLVKQLGELNTAVKAGKNDATLKGMIKEAHEIFHDIVEKCRDGQ
jgi:hypothetical protein